MTVKIKTTVNQLSLLLTLLSYSNDVTQSQILYLSQHIREPGHCRLTLVVDDIDKRF